VNWVIVLQERLAALQPPRQLRDLAFGQLPFKSLAEQSGLRRCSLAKDQIKKFPRRKDDAECLEADVGGRAERNDADQRVRDGP
jgi:hypothetical protein